MKKTVGVFVLRLFAGVLLVAFADDFSSSFLVSDTLLCFVFFCVCCCKGHCCCILQLGHFLVALAFSAILQIFLCSNSRGS